MMTYSLGVGMLARTVGILVLVVSLSPGSSQQVNTLTTSTMHKKRVSGTETDATNEQWPSFTKT